jgi:RNA polymerase sigma-70 factor (ECF subfamily)
MSAVDTLFEVEAAPAATTLGELLYRNPTRSVVSEAAWLALVQAIVARDAHALRALYMQTHRLVFTLAMRITSHKATAEEVTLDVFHEIWRRAVDYDPKEGTVVGWILSIARSRAVDRSSEPDLAALAFERHQQAKLFRSALSRLPPDERTAIEHAYFSRRLEEPLGTIKTRIRSGLNKLRHALSREGFP